MRGADSIDAERLVSSEPAPLFEFLSDLEKHWGSRIVSSRCLRSSGTDRRDRPAGAA